MDTYLPSRKVIAAALLAAIGTAVVVASGTVTIEGVAAIWAPVATAYGVSDA